MKLGSTSREDKLTNKGEVKGGGRGAQCLRIGVQEDIFVFLLGLVVVVVTNVVADMISSALLFFVFLSYVDGRYTYIL